MNKLLMMLMNETMYHLINFIFHFISYNVLESNNRFLPTIMTKYPFFHKNCKYNDDDIRIHADKILIEISKGFFIYKSL